MRTANGRETGEGWVLPGNERVCVITASATNEYQGGAACVQDSAAASGDLALEGGTTKAPGMEFVAGLVPDGVANVTLHASDGSTMTVPVTGNMYMQEVEGWVTDITFEGPSGPRTIEEPELPANMLPK